MLPILRDHRAAVRHHVKARTRGQSMVEFALILPVMLLILATAIDLGRMFYAYVAVQNAAKEGAFFGARHPLCDDSANTNCGDPNNVSWHVKNEAPNIGNQMATAIACRDTAGALVQPINNCLDGFKYQVTVTYPFQLITPILSGIFGTGFTLHSEAQATVLSDAFDPSGLEMLVWVNSTGSENGPAITAACTPADSVTSPNFYYQPCQDQNNVDNSFQFQENATVSYKIRVRNTGNINITGVSYTFAHNGSSMSPPGTCGSLPSGFNAGAAPAYCTFTTTATYVSPGDDAIAVTAEGSAQGLSTGRTNGAAVIKVVPAPKLAVNLWAAAYRLGGTGNGTVGAPNYPSGNMTLNRDTTSALAEIQNPTGWLYLSVVNQGGPASNFAVTVTEAGSAISLPGSCSVPSSLAGSGQSGSTFACIFPRTFSATQAYAFTATATATNSVLVSGTQRNVTVTTATCGSGKVVPNVVDTLNPSADGSNKTVLQARATWSAAGFTGAVTTNPATASNGMSSVNQSPLAYSCQNAGSALAIGAQ